MKQYVSLNKLNPGEAAIIHSLDGTGAIRRRLLDIGLTKNTEVVCVGRSPCGDPSAYLIRGTVIAIRSCDCANILVSQKEMSYGINE